MTAGLVSLSLSSSTTLGPDFEKIDAFEGLDDTSKFLEEDITITSTSGPKESISMAKGWKIN